MQMIRFTDGKGKDFLVNPDYITSIAPSDSLDTVEAKLKKHHLKYKNS